VQQGQPEQPSTGQKYLHLLKYLNRLWLYLPGELHDWAVV
jgi:hypothetical protein